MPAQAYYHCRPLPCHRQRAQGKGLVSRTCLASAPLSPPRCTAVKSKVAQLHGAHRHGLQGDPAGVEVADGVLRAARGRLTAGFGGQAHGIRVCARTAHLPQPLNNSAVPLPRTFGVYLRLAAQGPGILAVPRTAPHLN